MLSVTYCFFYLVHRNGLLHIIINIIGQNTPDNSRQLIRQRNRGFQETSTGLQPLQPNTQTVIALFHTAHYRPRNRIVMAPMTTWAGNDDGTVSHEEEAYYRRRVQDIGLVITGCTHVQQNGIGFTGELAAYDDKFIPGLKRLAIAAKSGGAPEILQIFHAGVKTSPELVTDIVAASAIPGDAGPFAPSVTPVN